MSMQPPKQTSGKAVGSLILGLLSLLCPPVFIFGLLAVILGFLGMGDAKRGKGGKGMAITGTLTGFLSLLCCMGIGIATPTVIIPNLDNIPVISNIRQSASRMQSANNMKQMVLAFHDYDAMNRKMPNHAIYSRGKLGQVIKPLLSWRVAILPFIEQDNLYRQFRLEEPWDSPHNKRLLEQMPRTFAHPWDPESAKKGLTHYQVFVGEPRESPCPPFQRGIPYYTSLSKLSAQDGTSNTILIVEASRPVPWTKPEDIPYSKNRPLPKLGVFSNGYHVGMGDGSVQFIRSSRITQKTLRNAITADDGMAIGPDFWP